MFTTGEDTFYDAAMSKAILPVLSDDGRRNIWTAAAFVHCRRFGYPSKEEKRWLRKDATAVQKLDPFCLFKVA